MKKTNRCQQPVVMICLLGLLILLTAKTRSETVDEAARTEPVTVLHAALLANMQQAETLDFQQRYDRLEPVILSCFDIHSITKVILGRYWKKLDEKAQQDFIRLFSRLMIATYADRFDSYTDEMFNVLSSEAMRRGRYLVRTELVTADKKPVSLDYIVQASQDKWKIISVIANGVNDLSLKRAEYVTTIKKDGYDALIMDIKTKVHDLTAR